MYEPSRTEKTILKTLNNILNANKNYFDTLKFKLITDHSARIRKKELYPKQQNSTKNALNYLTVKSDGRDYEFDLPYFLVQEAFTDLENSSEKKKLIYKNNNRENFLFIRKLITNHKNYFIDSLQREDRSTSQNAAKTFSTGLVMDILSEIVETICISHAPSEEQMNKYSSFAEALVNNIFTELKDNLPQLSKDDNNSILMPVSTYQFLGQELPGLVIDKASCTNTTTEDDTTEEKDTLDDMSSLNSSMGSHCRHLFVKNFLVKRRHSADVIQVNSFLDLKNNNNNTGYHVQLSNRRHSINSLSLSCQNGYKLNDELVELDNLRSPLNEITSTRLPILLGEDPGTLVQKSKVKIKKHKQSLKKAPLKHVFRENMSSFEDITMMKERPKISPSATKQFADQLVELAWLEAIDSVVARVKDVKEKYVEGFVESLFKESCRDVYKINKTINPNDRFYFKCGYLSAGEVSNLSSTLPLPGNSGSDGNISSLISIYCMVIALSECHLQNEITFVCSNLD